MLSHLSSHYLRYETQPSPPFDSWANWGQRAWGHLLWKQVTPRLRHLLKHHGNCLFLQRPLLEGCSVRDGFMPSKTLAHPEGFLGGPVAKTPCSQCRGPGFDPWSGN